MPAKKKAKPAPKRTPAGHQATLEVDWPFFGELCRALALKVARDFDPEVVLGIARAGAIPGVVVASILHPSYSRLFNTTQHAGWMLTGLILAAMSALLLVIRTRVQAPRAEAPRCVRCLPCEDNPRRCGAW